MNDNNVQIEKKIEEYEGILYDSSVSIEKAVFALNELLDKYEWNYEPTAQKAMEYGSAVGKMISECSDEAKLSWEYINDYKKIMWLINVARDYCYLILDKCNNVMETW